MNQSQIRKPIWLTRLSYRSQFNLNAVSSLFHHKNYSLVESAKPIFAHYCGLPLPPPTQPPLPPALTTFVASRASISTQAWPLTATVSPVFLYFFTSASAVQCTFQQFLCILDSINRHVLHPTTDTYSSAFGSFHSKHEEFKACNLNIYLPFVLFLLLMRYS